MEISWFLLTNTRCVHAFFCQMLFLDTVEEKTLFILILKTWNNETAVQSGSKYFNNALINKFILNQ
ncbi:MAG: hypothetical protein ACXABU_10545 [Candidatus Hodarchaeales archaeon]